MRGARRALAKSGQTEEAEQLFLESWNVLRDAAAISRNGAARRIAEFYNETGKADLAERYRATTRPTTSASR